MKSQDVRRALINNFSRFRFNSSDSRDDALQVGIRFALSALKGLNRRQYVAVSTYHGLLNEVSVHPTLGLAIASLEAAVKGYFDQQADDAAVYRITPGRSDTAKVYNYRDPDEEPESKVAAGQAVAEPAPSR
ncbi:MAG: hypothetical protein ACYC9Q_09045 [Bacillota bacterium]